MGADAQRVPGRKLSRLVAGDACGDGQDSPSFEWLRVVVRLAIVKMPELRQLFATSQFLHLATVCGGAVNDFTALIVGEPRSGVKPFAVATLANGA